MLVTPESAPEHAEGRLGRIANAQHGAFSRTQAIEVGVSASKVARRLASSVWVRVLPGVYRSTGTPESWHQRLSAACLWAGSDAVISHLTAARLHKLEGIPRLKRSDPIELTIPWDHVRYASGLVVHQSRTLEQRDRSTIDNIPVTSLARTLVDISNQLDQKHLCIAIDSGLVRHPSIDIRWLRREVARLQAKGRSLAPCLGRLLAERAPDAIHLDSALERRFSALLRETGLPRPTEHYTVINGGSRLAELDFAYPEARLGIQLNGAGIHGRHAVWERDQEQLSELAAAGWRVLLVTWAQLEADEASVVQRVTRALRAQGAPSSQ